MYTFQELYQKFLAGSIIILGNQLKHKVCIMYVDGRHIHVYIDVFN